ncbi:MAG: phosphoglucomutase/phosphomannomutase family protein [Oscillatoriales cyanobacterium SM2_2_1]|nr:phosphoglucomutase/phosphomannomutase family protein [Oscillatoriales cyanobacterium SM2_2_1]
MDGEAKLAKPIKFGTDGWRGIIADEFTGDRLDRVVPIAAQVLAETFPEAQRTVVVGYDRRFLSPEFAQRAADNLVGHGFNVLLSTTDAPTPAFSWAAHERQMIGALVITASHNPAIYSGLKIKGTFGGSVALPVTQAVEQRVNGGEVLPPGAGAITPFDPWESYGAALGQKVDRSAIRALLETGRLRVFVDAMHGVTAGGLARLLGSEGGIQELHTHRDPLFGGHPPEPLPQYLNQLAAALRSHQEQHPDCLCVGFIFDGDGDRIAAMDGAGTFLSSQILIPILIEHLTVGRGWTGEVIKTISGSELMGHVAKFHHLPVYETPVGYKYIAERMLSGVPVLLGGEESGGIGYRDHIPERDALLSALYLLEAIARTELDLSQQYRLLQERSQFFHAYDRTDVHLRDLSARDRLLELLASQPPTELAGRAVTELTAPDGYKFRLADDAWLLVRFSGTEPLLRLYCEAPTPAAVGELLGAIAQWVTTALS